jgi:hypothetical protein
MAVRAVSGFAVIALLGMFVSGCASDGMMGSSGNGGTSASTKNIDRVAAGAVEDSLNACLGRIPKDATAGQKMLAEESCRRDQAARR